MAKHWQCCCCERPTDSEAIKYTGRMLLTICVLAFSMTQIIRADECDGQLPFYTSLVTFIVGMELNKMKKGALEISDSDIDVADDHRQRHDRAPVSNSSDRNAVGNIIAQPLSVLGYYYGPSYIRDTGINKLVNKE